MWAPTSSIYSVSSIVNKQYHRHMQLPNYLCGVSTKQLELLVWNARPRSPTYPKDCTIFFIQLNNVIN